MDMPTTVLGWVWLIALGGLGYLFTITLVISIHELGHFLAARLFGVRVETFSIGFGRALAGFTDRYGTFWKVSALPVGGYVKFWGDEGISSSPDHDKVDHASAEERVGSFHHKPLWQKAIIAVGGPAANFVLALAIWTGMFLIYGERLIAPQIGYVGPGSPAEKAGVHVGDVVVSIGGIPVREFWDIVQIVNVRAGQQLPIVLRRGGAEVSSTITPELIEKTDMLGNKIMDAGIGISPVQPGKISSVEPGSPAALAGLKADDVIVLVGGKQIESLSDVSKAILDAKPGAAIALTVVHVGPQPRQTKESDVGEYKIVPRATGGQAVGADAIVAAALGVEVAIKGAPKSFNVVTYGPIGALDRSFGQVRFIVVKTLDFIGRLLTGRGDYKQLSGPIGIAAVSGQVAVFLGVVELINLAAVLSLSIGLLNLFPIPMLDGGHLLYYGIEAVRGRPLGERAQELGFRIGFALVVCLMLFATWNDITKIKLF